MMDLEAKHSALLVIDVQNDFCHPDGVTGRAGIPLQHVHSTMPVLQKFIEDVRATDAKIIFVRTIHSDWSNCPVWELRSLRTKGTVCAPDTWGAEFYEVKPNLGDLIITKHRYSAFIGTDLDLILRSQNIQSLLCTGFITNVCVESTLRDAFMLNYYTVLIEDCCAAPTLDQHSAAVFNARTYFGAAEVSSSVLSHLK
jgi:ureidoacrylate peracid hydrolase